MPNLQNSNDPVSLRDEGSYALLSLDLPEKLNCLSEAMLSSLESAVATLESSMHHRVLVVTGSGGVFSVGADLTSLGSLDPVSARQFSHRGQRLMSRFEQAHCVTIAAIDGYCLGGGLDLALSCDFRYASPRSSFQHPGVRRGIITGWGGNVRLPRLIGKDAARRYFLTGERIGAPEAHRLGLINGLREEPLRSARAVATLIGDNWTSAQIAAAKRACQINR